MTYEYKVGSLKVPLVPAGDFAVTKSQYIDHNGQSLDEFLKDVGGNLPQYTTKEYEEAAAKGEIEAGKAFIITDDQGSGGGTSDYDKLENQPRINGITLTGNMSADELGLQLNIPRYTKAEYEAVKDSIPVNTLFIITDEEE